MIIKKLMMMVFCFGVMWLLCQNIFAHSGGTNRDGCHRDHSTGDYHCHGKRSPGAYEKQMKGFSQSRSVSWFWILVVVGIAYAFFQGIDRGDYSKNKISKKVGSDRKIESKDVAISEADDAHLQRSKLKGLVKDESPSADGGSESVSQAVSLRELYKVQCDVSVFDEHELDVLERYGRWMSELSRGEREPVTTSLL
jgi:hypothetical protein